MLYLLINIIKSRIVIEQVELMLYLLINIIKSRIVIEQVELEQCFIF